MASNREEGPVYYREIQKNAYLKRIPMDISGKLRPLAHKKPPFKPMWTQFCVHNGRTPFLEQYPEPDSPAAMTHTPTWRACLLKARHVTASVKPHIGEEYDFLIDTDNGPVRMLAPDWHTMQDWVTCLRNKLQELKIIQAVENVYCPAPVAPVARAGSRDPTSPLPPPPRPPDRVPGIELNPPRTQITQPQTTSQPLQTQTHSTQATTTTSLSHSSTSTEQIHHTMHSPPRLVQNTFQAAENMMDNQVDMTVEEDVDISNWDYPYSSLPLPSTSNGQESRNNNQKGVKKICGQNICLDDSILQRNVDETDSDEDFFAEIDKVENDSDNVEVINKHDGNFKQRLVVNNDNEASSLVNVGDIRPSEFQGTNVTVIQVSNKEPPHTAIPVLGTESNVFNFDFKQKLSIKPEDCSNSENNFVNIVNTESNNVNTTDSGSYGTVFTTKESEYGHISLTTTVSLTGEASNATVKVTDENGIYERLCMASTSNANRSPLPVKKLKSLDKTRNSSLPNLEVQASSNDTTYEYLYPNSQNINNNIVGNNLNVNIVNSVEVNNAQNERSYVRLTNSIGLNANANSSIRANIERSHSQNAYDSSPHRRDNIVRRVQNNSPKRDAKQENTQTKPIWKRGLTELSLLSRLRGIGQGKRQESPNRQEPENERSATSPVKVIRRSRPENRADSTRRRSSSLSNGQSPTADNAALLPLIPRQAAWLRAEQRRGAALVAKLRPNEPPLFVDYERRVWIARWPHHSVWHGGRSGDRIASVRGTVPKDAAHAEHLFRSDNTLADILYHRVPLAKIYVLNKKNGENIGIKLDSDNTIVLGRGPVPPPGKWALTEVNHRPLNLIKGGEDDMNRLSLHATEVSLLIQPAPLVKRMRTAIKSYKPKR